jgi:hypothetical protein
VLPQHWRHMDAQTAQVAELLHEAAETHHRVYRIVDGADDDWASWYGDWLVRLSELPQVLGSTGVGCRKSVRGSRRLPRVFVQQAA